MKTGGSVEKVERDERDTSLLYWFPKVENLAIAVPRTEMVRIKEDELRHLYNEEIAETLVGRVAQGILNFKLPVFIRTDLASGKHNWNKSCFYNGMNKLSFHLWNVVEENLMADIIGLPFKAIVIREYIEMESGFTAFPGKLPISKERRYFVRDEKVVEHFPYWPEKAISKSYAKPSAKNWKKILKKLNKESDKEIKLLTEYAERIGKVLSGFWSVDFCKSKEGIWYLIDMAKGEVSWKP